MADNNNDGLTSSIVSASSLTHIGADTVVRPYVSEIIQNNYFGIQYNYGRINILSGNYEAIHEIKVTVHLINFVNY
jgi:hypothetical protein